MSKKFECDNDIKYCHLAVFVCAFWFECNHNPAKCALEQVRRGKTITSKRCRDVRENRQEISKGFPRQKGGKCVEKICFFENHCNRNPDTCAEVKRNVGDPLPENCQQYMDECCRRYIARHIDELSADEKYMFFKEHGDDD